MRNTVDFPEPDGPSSATTSLRATATEMFSSTRSGLPLGSMKSCDTCRASHNTSRASGAFLGVMSFAQRKTLFGHAVAPAPDRAIEGDDEHRHHEDRRGEARAVGARGRTADLRAQPCCLERLSLERHVFRHDARVPGAAG